MKVVKGTATSRGSAVKKIDAEISDMVMSGDAKEARVVIQKCRIKDEVYREKLSVKYNSRTGEYEAEVEFITRNEHKQRMSMTRDEWLDHVRSISVEKAAELERIYSGADDTE